jgi:hypothetical protein
MSLGLLLRAIPPAGMNVCAPHLPLSRDAAVKAIVQPPSNILDDELRRNCFWVAYAMDRFHTSGVSWASGKDIFHWSAWFTIIAGLDDEDITQVLPLSVHSVSEVLLQFPYFPVCDRHSIDRDSHIRQTAVIYALCPIHASRRTNGFLYSLCQGGVSAVAS